MIPLMSRMKNQLLQGGQWYRVQNSSPSLPSPSQRPLPRPLQAQTPGTHHRMTHSLHLRKQQNLPKRRAAGNTRASGTFPRVKLHQRRRVTRAQVPRAVIGLLQITPGGVVLKERENEIDRRRRHPRALLLPPGALLPPAGRLPPTITTTTTSPARSLSPVAAGPPGAPPTSTTPPHPLPRLPHPLLLSRAQGS